MKLLLFILPLALADYRAMLGEKRMLIKGDILTFYSDKTTIGRRKSSRAQILRLPGKEMAFIDKVDCTYITKKKWNCVANIPKIYIWNKMNVDCEGYPSRDSPYILKGSCQFQYNLAKKWSILKQIAFCAFIGFCSYKAPWWVPALCMFIIAVSSGRGARRARRGRYLRGNATGSRS